jgi:hypothetical protein
VLGGGLGRVLVQSPVSGSLANVVYQFMSSTGVCEYRGRSCPSVDKAVWRYLGSRSMWLGRLWREV